MILGIRKNISSSAQCTWKDIQHHQLLQKCKSKLQWDITSYQSEGPSWKSPQPFSLWTLSNKHHWSLSLLTVIISRSVSQRAWTAMEAFPSWTGLWNNWWESEKPFWAMGNAHRLYGIEGSKHHVFQRLRVCHICQYGGGGCGQEGKATQGGQKSSGTEEGCLKRRCSETCSSLNCEKDFCWWH